jgi:hypothetical protein
VFGYNYSTNTLQGEGERNLNQGWISPDISVHGHYPFMNLFEGNEVEEIGISDYWGPAGPGNTYFRNKVKVEGIFYYDHSDFQNVIGNITTGITNSDSTSKNMIEFGNVINQKVQTEPVSGGLLPASLYLKSKPAFLTDTIWPVFGPDVQSEVDLPAADRVNVMKNEE